MHQVQIQKIIHLEAVILGNLQTQKKKSNVIFTDSRLAFFFFFLFYICRDS